MAGNGDWSLQEQIEWHLRVASLLVGLAASNHKRGHESSPTPSSAAPAPSAKTTLKTEIMFALTPDFTNTRDKPPAHADARDFNGLLPANSGISSMPRIIPKAPGFAMKNQPDHIQWPGHTSLIRGGFQPTSG